MIDPPAPGRGERFGIARQVGDDDRRYPLPRLPAVGDNAGRKVK
jgi:hypothetical protein